MAKIETFITILHQQGAHTALEFLNSRMPHRYTGLFRFDGDTLRNEALFDRSQERTTDVSLLNAAAALLYEHLHLVAATAPR